MQPISSASPIVFSVPGSGKTQYIFDLLSRRWGHYFVSGRVPQPLMLNPDATLFNARQGSASSDIRHLREILDMVDPSDIELHTEAWARLVSNRDSILTLILDSTMTKENESHFTPRSWLLFQTSCTKMFDPFLRTFQVKLMLESKDLGYPSMFFRTDDLHVQKSYLPQSMYFCLDEAQCELDYAPGNPYDEKSSSLRFLLAFINGGLFPGKESQFVASGTALKVRRFKQTLEDCVTRQWESTLRRLDTHLSDDYARLVEQGYKANIFCTSKTVDSYDNFEKLLSGHAFRVVDRIGYLIYIGKATEEYRLWQVFSIKSAHITKKQFYTELAARLVN